MQEGHRPSHSRNTRRRPRLCADESKHLPTIGCKRTRDRGHPIHVPLAMPQARPWRLHHQPTRGRHSRPSRRHPIHLGLLSLAVLAVLLVPRLLGLVHLDDEPCDRQLHLNLPNPTKGGHPRDDLVLQDQAVLALAVVLVLRVAHCEASEQQKPRMGSQDGELCNTHPC